MTFSHDLLLHECLILLLFIILMSLYYIIYLLRQGGLFGVTRLKE